MYHRVLDPANSDYFLQPGMYVSLKSFELHLELLKKKYTVLPLKELLEGFFLKKKAFKKCCAITFDDGWLDNYTNAFPLLVNYETPATIFLATRYVGQKSWFWEEEVAFFLHENSQQEIDLLFESILTTSQYQKLATLKMNMNVTEIIFFMKQLDKDLCKKIVHQIRKQNGQIKHRKRLVVNWEEAKKMQAYGIDFFSHSHSHVLLTNLSYNQAEKDIKTSQILLEKKIKTVQNIFCYPSGRFSDKVKKLLKDNGIKYALTTQRSPLSLSQDTFSIPRIGIHDDISRTSTLFKLNLY